MPKLGKKSICKSCGRAIVYTGKYWEHKDYSPRHPAVPVKKSKDKSSTR